MSTIEEMETTARLLLIMKADKGEDYTLMEFAKDVREEHPTATQSDVSWLWQRYKGMDGRTKPTHNFYTGERL